MFYQIEKINKEVNIIRKKQTEILELKNTVTKMKISLQAFNSKYEASDKRISRHIDQWDGTESHKITQAYSVT